MILNVDYLIIVSPIFTFLEVHNASVGLMRITIILCYYILLWAGSSDAWHTSSRFLIQKSKYVLNKVSISKCCHNLNEVLQFLKGSSNLLI